MPGASRIGALLLVGIVLVFHCGHHALREKLASRPLAVNVQGLIMPGASRMASRRDISGALDSATSVSAIDRRPTKGFDFRPRFSGYRNSGHSLVKAGNETQDLQPKYYGRLRSALSAGKAVDSKSSGHGQNSREGAPAIVLAGGLPGPFESGQSWFHQNHTSNAAKDSVPAVAAAAAAAAAAKAATVPA